MAINNFGKKVSIVVTDGSGGVVLDTGGLRTDFKIDMISGMTKALFTIYNLSPASVKALGSGDRYVQVITSLHDSGDILQPFKFYINNTVHIKEVPNNKTELYCLDILDKTFMSKTINITTKNPSLERVCRNLAKEAKANVKFEFIDFPKKLKDHIPLNPASTWSGTARMALDKLGRAYSFTVHLAPNNVIRLIYLPLAENLHLTDQASRDSLTLSTSNMLNNPSIGISTLKLTSILDFSIIPAVILDTNNLVTSSAGESFDFLALTKDQVKGPSYGITRYKVLTVQHNGSSHTDSWSTKVSANKPIKGTTT